MYTAYTRWHGRDHHKVSPRPFTLVESALDGKQVRVTHKGRKFRIVPEAEGEDL
jgi:hypothetical protein